MQLPLKNSELPTIISATFGHFEKEPKFDQQPEKQSRTAQNVSSHFYSPEGATGAQNRPMCSFEKAKQSAQANDFLSHWHRS